MITSHDFLIIIIMADEYSYLQIRVVLFHVPCSSAAMIGYVSDSSIINIGSSASTSDLYAIVGIGVEAEGSC